MSALAGAALAAIGGGFSAHAVWMYSRAVKRLNDAIESREETIEMIERHRAELSGWTA